MTSKRVSKSQFKLRPLEFFRHVQKTGRELIITERGRPVLRISLYAADPEEALRSLRGSVLNYVDPTEPVATDDWEA
jgi:antitoxin (DNA-binding transcriptional repressor) of toxin-antitoxin stability system